MNKKYIYPILLLCLFWIPAMSLHTQSTNQFLSLEISDDKLKVTGNTIGYGSDKSRFSFGKANLSDVNDEWLILKESGADDNFMLEFKIDFCASDLGLYVRESTGLSYWGYHFTADGDFDLLFNGSSVLNDQNCSTTSVYKLIRCGDRLYFYENGTRLYEASFSADDPIWAVLDYTQAVSPTEIYMHYFQLSSCALPGMSYIQPKPKLDGQYILHNGDELAISYREKYESEGSFQQVATYKVYDPGGTEVLSVDKDSHYGTNTHVIDISTLSSGTRYRMEISGANKGETVYVEFVKE